jgi:hypothetical protein
VQPYETERKKGTVQIGKDTKNKDLSLGVAGRGAERNSEIFTGDKAQVEMRYCAFEITNYDLFDNDV